MEFLVLAMLGLVTLGATNAFGSEEEEADKKGDKKGEKKKDDQKKDGDKEEEKSPEQELMEAIAKYEKNPPKDKRIKITFELQDRE
ncbi:MAG: hypothetical protein MUF72_06975 [Elainella sp. Prado103]|jgi:hypothetical protein|nr:hypothetical protein [Elainella sp. Prado103]